MAKLSITRVVASTDFSQPGNRAVKRAALIAKGLGVELHLLHVINPLELYPDLGSFDIGRQELERLHTEAAEKKLKSLAASLQQEHSIGSIARVIRTGRAYRQIHAYASTDPNTLVVVGSRGENNMLDLLVGSTASRLLNVATYSVLLVRNAKKTGPYNRVIAAVDCSEECDHFPEIARSLAPEAEIEILHVFDLIQETQLRDIGIGDEMLKEYKKEAVAKITSQFVSMVGGDARTTVNVLSGYPTKEICDRARAIASDLIMVQRQGKSSLDEFFVGSVSKDVASTASCDVLLVPTLKDN